MNSWLDYDKKKRYVDTKVKGRYPSRPTTSHFRRQTARRWKDARRFQYSEGKHFALSVET